MCAVAGGRSNRWPDTEVLDILQIVLKRELKARADSQRRPRDRTRTPLTFELPR